MDSVERAIVALIGTAVVAALAMAKDQPEIVARALDACLCTVEDRIVQAKSAKD